MQKIIDIFHDAKIALIIKKSSSPFNQKLYYNDVKTKVMIVLENVFAKSLSCAHYLMDAKINHMMIESDDVSQ